LLAAYGVEDARALERSGIAGHFVELRQQTEKAKAIPAEAFRWLDQPLEGRSARYLTVFGIKGAIE
jgi:hypothetical protein